MGIKRDGYVAQVRKVRRACVVALTAAVGLSAAEAPGLRVSAGARQRLQRVCGTSAARLVFQSGSALWLVDFSEQTPQPRRIPGTPSTVLPSFDPAISPDGRWVAWISGVAGGGDGVVYLSRADGKQAPRLIADGVHAPAFVPGAGRDTLEVICVEGEYPARSWRTLCIRIAGESGRVIDKKVLFDRGLNGGASRGRRYLSGVLPEPAGDAVSVDLARGETRPKLMHTLAATRIRGKADTVVTPVCYSPSASPGVVNPDAMLYLDVGSSVLRSTGCAHRLLGVWNAGDILFVSRRGADAGEAVRSYWVPADITVRDSLDRSLTGRGDVVGAVWSEPSWSNHPYFAVGAVVFERQYFTGGAWTRDRRSERIYLVDLRTGSCVRLVESVDTGIVSQVSLRSPALWVEMPLRFREEAAWLAGSRLGRDRAPVYDDNETVPAPRVSLVEGTIVSSTRIEALSVYSVLGQEMYRIRPQEPQSVRLASYGPFRPGVYFVHVELAGGGGAVVRWSVDAK